MWGIYWRYLMSLALLLALAASWDNQFEWLHATGYLSLKPTIVWLCFALVLSLITLMQNKGLTYIWLGYRLKLKGDVWKKYNAILIAFFIALSILSYVVSVVASLDFWKSYKLFAQTSLLILLPLFAAWYVVRPLKTTPGNKV